MRNLQPPTARIMPSISDYTFVMQTRQKEFDGFQRLYARFLQEEGPSVDWDSIEKLPGDAVKNYNTLRQPAAEQVQNMLSKLVVVKLNGGLGTSMGCQGPKSVIAVRSDLTFLDLTVQQIEVSQFHNDQAIFNFKKISWNKNINSTPFNSYE